MTKMLADGGAIVNLMSYSMFRKHWKSADDLIKTNMLLNDFNGNPSEAKGVLYVELAIRSRTLPIAFFITDTKGSYNLLLGTDWIHAKCCVPSTMHQVLIQWDGDQEEIIQADGSANIATTKTSIWEMEGVKCLSGTSPTECYFLRVSE